MVAPNGARRTKSDHPEIPVTIEETVRCAIECRDAGADGLHAHVRDDEQAHVLDAGLYRELLDECALRLPGFAVQITTEAIGKYSPQEQAKLVCDVKPAFVSVALSEIRAGTDLEFVTEFYQQTAAQGTVVQHILYAPEELVDLARFIELGAIPDHDLQLLFVLGRYTHGQQSSPGMLDPFLVEIEQHFSAENLPDWACCAFGQGESDCLVHAHHSGGKMRVGFENSLWHHDGRLAQNNAERVSAIVQAVEL